jgi:ethanolamine utilization protein EutA
VGFFHVGNLMNASVKLVGLDFGTTTSSALVATARLTRNSVTGRMDLSDVRQCFRSDLVFTPLRDDRLDIPKLEAYLDAWLASGAVRRTEVFGGGALLTGLTAQKDNAGVLVEMIRRRLGGTLVASADDPCLESWLAFMGSSAPLSRAHPNRPVLNLDIGGGTTNLALGKAGEVLRTGCLFVGARHIQVEPGTYRIIKISPYARALLDSLGVHKENSDCLTEAEVDSVLDFYVRLLTAAAAGVPEVFQDPVARLHQQVAFHLPAGNEPALVTLSGGVGELVYGHLQGKPWPPTTHYGDLGIDLARRLVSSAEWGEKLRKYQPASAGRATVYGLLRHNTEISGSTVFLPRPEVLPLEEMPVFGSLFGNDSDSHLLDLLNLVRRSPRGGCLYVMLAEQGATGVRALGEKIHRILQEQAFPAAHPLVFLVRENVGKVLGHYVTAWGALPLNLVVLDEIAVRDAQYAQIGVLRNQVIPVSFYGLREKGETP